jgi:hypothetical protein
MSNTYCFVSKEGSKYEQALKKQWSQEPLWKKVIMAMSVHLNEEIKTIYAVPGSLGFPSEVINKFSEHNQKHFKKDGFIKANGKDNRQLNQFYNDLLEKWGLQNYQSPSDIRFCFQMFRFHGENCESFRDFQGRTYSKCSFDQNKRSGGDQLDPITEVEYAETYAQLLREQEEQNKQVI